MFRALGHTGLSRTIALSHYRTRTIAGELRANGPVRRHGLPHRQTEAAPGPDSNGTTVVLWYSGTVVAWYRGSVVPSRTARLLTLSCAMVCLGLS